MFAKLLKIYYKGVKLLLNDSGISKNQKCENFTNKQCVISNTYCFILKILWVLDKSV